MPFTLYPPHAAIFGAGALVALLSGCGLSTGELKNADQPRSDAQVPPGNGDDGVPGGGGFGPGESCDIQALMALPENGCTNAGCHGAQFQGGLDLASPGLAQRLMGAVSQTNACNGQPLVDAENVDNSLILRLIDPDRFAAAACGVMMPLGSSNGVSSKSLACFEAWVRDLATGDATPIDPPPAFEAVGPQSYVNKVKTLLTGKAATADEVASVTADQAALAQLVSGWVDSPEYMSKLQDFFSVALQQRLDGSLDPQFRRLQRSAKLPALQANLAESFVRTAATIVAEDRPFSEVLTTRRWAMTTASLAAMAFIDQTSAALQAEKHTLVSGTGTDSVATRTWHLPNVRAGCTIPPSIPSAGMFNFMLGYVSCAEPGAYRFDQTILTAADFTDWRMVDINQARSAAETPRFYDMSSLRGATSISLVQPRIGFFTSPSFLANWDTNEDNQFRVTTSQTLIVALNQIFSPADPTTPVRLDGLATEHATPGSTCYGCHQFLDPMRQYFARNFSFNYQPTKPSTITPSFAFQGQVHDGGTLLDFAKTLAAHPSFATGWTQKLCYWANSQPCDEDDPEFKRVVAAFVSSGFKFKRLVVELLSSALVTGASETQSASTHAPFVSITRKQHLCQLLNVRLGIDNACKVAASFAGLVPEDDFGRGSAEPVQSAVTGLFHFAAAEKLCLRLATTLVANTPTARFAPGNAEAALDSFVHDLMGLGVGHPRSVDVRARLAAHYESTASTTNALNGLRSVFTIACMSPEVMAVGL